MKTFHKIYITGFALILALFVVSCIPEQESIGDAGSTFVKLHPAGYNMLAFDAKTTAQSGVLFEVRRDVPNEADLNSTSTVELKYDTDTTMLKAYNTANHTSFIPLPSSLGTVSPAITGGKVTLNFAAGDIGLPIKINIPNAGNFDFSKNYAMAFKILSVSGTGALSEAVGKEIVVEVLVKNKWDGIYTVTGTFVDYLTPAWTGIYPKTVELRTTGANTCDKYDSDYGVFGYIFETGTGASQFGAWTPAFKFNADGTVEAFNTSVDSPARGRSVEMYTGDGAVNKYFTATKSMDVSFYLKQLNVSPQLRSLVTEHYAYKGPR